MPTRLLRLFKRKNFIIQHIEGELHKKAVSCNRFTMLINDLASKFKKSTPVIEEKKISIE